MSAGVTGQEQTSDPAPAPVPGPAPEPTSEPGPLRDEAYEEAKRIVVNAAKSGAREVVDRARLLSQATLDETVESALDLVTVRLPRLLSRLLLTMTVVGAVGVSLGVFAVVAPELFLKVIVPVTGVLMVVGGILLWYAAYRLHEGTAVFRALVLLLSRWRARGGRDGKA